MLEFLRTAASIPAVLALAAAEAVIDWLTHDRQDAELDAIRQDLIDLAEGL